MQSPDGSHHVSRALRGFPVSFSPSATLNSAPGRILPQSSSTPTWYIARTTIDRKNTIQYRPFCVCVSRLGAVPVHLCRTPRSARSARARAADRRPPKCFLLWVAPHRRRFPRQAQHSASRQFFEDDDTLHPQRRRTCHCVRPSRNHALVPIPVHYAPNPYDSNPSHTRVRMRLENFFKPDNVPR